MGSAMGKQRIHKAKARQHLLSVRDSVFDGGVIVGLNMIPSFILLLLEQLDGQLHNGLLRLLVDLPHLLGKVVLEIDRVLLRVNVDLSLVVERLQTQLRHPFPYLFLDLGAIGFDGHDVARLPEEGRSREVVLELQVDWFSRFCALVGVEVEGELEPFCVMSHQYSYIISRTYHISKPSATNQQSPIDFFSLSPSLLFNALLQVVVNNIIIIV